MRDGLDRRRWPGRAHAPLPLRSVLGHADAASSQSQLAWFPIPIGKFHRRECPELFQEGAVCSAPTMHAQCLPEIQRDVGESKGEVAAATSTREVWVIGW